MDNIKASHTRKNKFLKLSLRKNKIKCDDNCKKYNRSSDVIVLDESFDAMRQEFPKSVPSKGSNCSPIVINDSSEFSDDEIPKIALREPSLCGNVSFDCPTANESPHKDKHPSSGGWSPAQHIITAAPKNDTQPSTPKDRANESYEQCSLKKVQESQKKILTDIYGDVWKSIPKLFKNTTQDRKKFDGVTKKLFDDEESEISSIRKQVKINKQLYLTGIKDNRAVNFGDTEKKSRKKLFQEQVNTPDIVNQKPEESGDTDKKSKRKLYTEKVPTTPDVKLRPKDRNVNSTSKKVKIKKGMSVTELVQIMNKDLHVNSKETDENNLLKTKIDADKSTKKLVTNNVKSNKENIPKNDINTDLAITNKPLSNNNSTVKSIDENKLLQNKTDIDKPLTKKVKDIDRKVLAVDKCDVLTRIENLCVTPKTDVQRLSFIGSLAENVPSWRCHPEALQYRDDYKTLRDQLTARLYTQYNRDVFDNALDPDMSITWDSKLRRTAGTTTNRLVKTARGEVIRRSSIKLSSKVLDAPERLRDTLIHELCHSATWIIDNELKAGHGPLWKKWAKRALRIYPELGEISRCHDMDIHFKYTYKCTRCGYRIHRHSKSIDVTKKACGYCRGAFEIEINRKDKDGVVITTPARKGPPNGFALYVKENYADVKNGGKTHAQVMKILGEQFSAKKHQNTE